MFAARRILSLSRDDKILKAACTEKGRREIHHLYALELFGDFLVDQNGGREIIDQKQAWSIKIYFFFLLI